MEESISVPHRNRSRNLSNIAWMLLDQLSYNQPLVDLVSFTFEIVLFDRRRKDGGCDLPYRWNLVFYSNQATIRNLKTNNNDNDTRKVTNGKKVHKTNLGRRDQDYLT